MKVREIMSTKVRAVSPATHLDEVARIMRDEDVGIVPVVDDGNLQGVVTDRDIVVRCVAEGDNPSTAEAGDLMSVNPRTVKADSEVDDAARILSEEQIRRLPIVENGKLVGMLSLGDVAVKHSDQRLAGDVLENVSEGVKASAPGQRTAAAKVRAPQPAGATGGGRQQRLEQQAGRRAPASARRAQPSRGLGAADEGDVDRSIDTGRSQGIAARPATEEQRRQSKVVPIRRGQPSKAAETAGRRQSGARKRKTG